MSETKRLDITNVSTPQKQKKLFRKQRTYRIDVPLGESSSETCPEYSFVDCIKKEKPKNGEPFDDTSEAREIAAIAQRFEAKYGPKGLQSGMKTRTQEMDDYYDPGEGYDEDDPFIDNTEAYDEVIPSSMTTQHGGFYINQGKLDFRYLHEDPTNIRKIKRKMRVLESDAEDESGPALAKKFNSLKHKMRLEGKQLEKKMKVTDSEDGEEQIVKKKQKLKLIKPTPDSVSQKDKTDSAVTALAAATTAAAVTINAVAVTAPSISIATTVASDAVDTGSAMLRDDQLKSIEEIFNSVLNDNINEDSCSKSGEEGKGENQLIERNTQLPSQLPAELLEAIENMKREAKESKEKKFFSTYINRLLLDIELGSHKLPWGSKTAIYSHLSEHLPCGKYTLQRRAKKLRESQEEDQLKEPIRKLREAIMKVMPGQQERHEMDVQKAKMNAEAKEEQGDGVKEELSTESEGEEKSDARKKPRGPRRKFHWNSEIRALLLGIVATKVRHYNTFKSRNQTAEEYLKAYLDLEIKPLWPQGWMQTRTLFKESRKAHEELTKGVQQQGKQKKVFTSIDATPASTEMTYSNLSKKAAVDLAATNTENKHLQISNTEHVIEVSSILDDGSKSKNTVIINLPNTMAALPQSFYNSTTVSSVSGTGHLSSHSIKKSVALPQMVEISASPVTSFVAQKPCFTSASSSVKEVVPAAFPEASTALSAAANELQSLIAAFPQGGLDTNVVVPPVLPTSSSNNSYSGSLGDLNNNGSVKSTLLSPSQQQQVRSVYNKLNSQRPRISSLLQKSVPGPQTTNINRPKQSLMVQTVANSLQQTADSRLSPHGVVKNSNSSWTTMSSLVPSGQSANPVSVSRAADIAAQKHSAVLVTTGISVQENQILLPQTQQQKILGVPGKPNQSVTQKKSLLGNGSSSSSIVHSMPGSEIVNRPGVTSVKAPGPSFKEDSTNSKLVQYQGDQKKSGLPNQQLKSGVVMATPSSAQMLNTQHQQLRTGIVIGTGALPLFKPHKAADFAGWTSSKSRNIRQPSPLGKTTTTSAQNTAVTAARSSPIPASALSNKSPSLFNKSSSSPMSRISTPSPQMSPMSPAEVTALSLYEQIRTQVQHQEAIEGQALKNLAMALKLGGASDADLFRMKSETVKDVGRTSQLFSKISGTDGRAVALPDGLPQTLLGCSYNSTTRGENMQGTNSKELASGAFSKMSSKDLIHSSCHQKAFQKHEQFCTAISSTNQNRSSPVLGNKKVVHSLPVSERSVLCDKFPFERPHDGTKLQQVASCEAMTANNSVSPVLNRQGSNPCNASFRSHDRDSFISSPMLPDSTLRFHASASQEQTKPSNVLPNTKRLTGNESLVRSKKTSVHSSLVPSTHGHTNIFAAIEQSIPGCPLSTQTAKDWFSSNSCPENDTTSTSRSVKSLPDKLRPTLQMSSSTILPRPLSQSSLGSVEIEKINERGSSNSCSPGSFQDAFSRYATHLLKGFAPYLNSSNKTSQLQSSDLIRSRSEDVSGSIRSMETTQPERSLGQDGNAKSSQEA